MKKKKKSIYKFFISIIFILVLGFFFILYYIFNIYMNNKLFNRIEKKYAYINKLIIYGNHLNIEGNLNIDTNNIEKAHLILKNHKEEIEIKTEFYIDDFLYFKTSNLINEGINLETINDNYIVLLKVIQNNEEKFYSLKNKTNYNKTNYYSLNNKKLEFKFKEKQNIPYLNVDISNNSNSYDIVIDAGHGGNDPGAINGNNYESNFTLEYSLALKKKLESLGYKIKLTRDSDITLKTYGKNSRTSIPYEAKAKYIFSIHMNSYDTYIYKGGVEIYTPSNINIDFAKSIADNIVEKANTIYSSNNNFKIDKGVYIKNFTNTTINESNNYAKENNFEPYNITKDTPYLYMIRETGGIITNAYVDGRNKKYEKNPYYNSNIGIESYLLELGYINNNEDLNNLKNNKDSYVESIAEAIDNHIKKQKNP